MNKDEVPGHHPAAEPQALYMMGRPVENPVVIDHTPDCLTLEKLLAVARGDDEGRLATVAVAPESLKRCERSAAMVREAIMRSHAEFLSASPENRHLFLIYGVNTGFGINRDKPVETFADCCRLSENILLSHASGVGPPLPSEVVRATMLLRLRTFAQGRSGVRPELLRLLIEMLNRRVHPWVPSQGSVGSSGDLCSLSHLSLVLIGQGKAWVETDYPNHAEYPWDDAVDGRGAPLTGEEALRSVGLSPLEPFAVPNGSDDEASPRLGPKEGLALTNGATVSTAITALAVHDAEVLLSSANLAGAMTFQAMGGITRAFEPNVQAARRHEGQKDCAVELMALLSNPDAGGLDNRAAILFNAQDDYCLRAMPPVHGAALSAIRHAREVIEPEMNAVTDNPLIFCETEDGDYIPYDKAVSRAVSHWPVYSAANFHGEPVGILADYLKIALSELASISERRSEMLLDGKRSRGLPTNLLDGQGGLNSGLMLFQYTAASLVSENKVLCHPASCDSIPTSSNAEDHVSMATTAARHLRQVALNVANVLAIELICAAQAIVLRTAKRVHVSTALHPNLGSRGAPGKELDQEPSISPPCSAALGKILSVSSFVTQDADFEAIPPHLRISSVRKLIVTGTLLREARKLL